MLAQTPTPDEWDSAITILRNLGIPGGWLLLIAFVARKIFFGFSQFFREWVIPHCETCIHAYQERQVAMSECQKKLTESTIDIQTKNSEMLQVIHDRVQLGLCSWAREFDAHLTTQNTPKS